MSANISTLTTSTFDEVINSSTEPVVVDFWAEWCGPCLQLAPILDQIAEERAGRLSVAKVNIDEHPEIAQRFQVMSIPTMLVFDGGVLVNRVVGARPKDAVLAELPARAR